MSGPGRGPRKRGRDGDSILRGIEFAVWALKLEKQPTVDQIMEEFDVRLSTAYRYRAAWLESNAFAIFHRDLQTEGMYRIPKSDMFEGVFDDDARGERVKYRDGRIVATLHRNACANAPIAKDLGMEGAFGTFPPPPPWLPAQSAAANPGESP